MSSCQGLPHPGGTLGSLTLWTMDRGPRKAHHTDMRPLAENVGVKRWGLSFAPTWLWACWLPDLHPDLSKVSFIGLGLKKHSVGSSAKVTSLETLHHSRLAPLPPRTSTMSWGSYSKQARRKQPVKGKEKSNRKEYGDWEQTSEEEISLKSTDKWHLQKDVLDPGEWNAIFKTIL